jgi:hypothetical protein
MNNLEPEKPFPKFIRLHPEYPSSESSANVRLFAWIREHGNDFSAYESFENAWNATRTEIIQDISSKNAEKFLAKCPQFPLGDFNAGMMNAHIRTQVGDDRVWTVENFWAAFEYLSEAGKFVRNVDLQLPASEPVPVHPAHSLADAMNARAAEEARLRKLSPIGKPIPKKLRVLAIAERRANTEPNRLRDIDKTPHLVGGF